MKEETTFPLHVSHNQYTSLKEIASVTFYNGEYEDIDVVNKYRELYGIVLVTHTHSYVGYMIEFETKEQACQFQMKYL